jgi:hypothetical protein
MQTVLHPDVVHFAKVDKNKDLFSQRTLIVLNVSLKEQANTVVIDYWKLSETTRESLGGLDGTCLRTLPTNISTWTSWQDFIC